MFSSGLSENTESKKVTRRAFLAVGASAAAGFALLSRHRMPAVEAKSTSGTPGEVTIVNFDDSGKRLDKVRVAKIVKTDAEWRQQLSANAFDIARRADTEMAYSGSTWNEHGKGIFRCICCDTALFSSQTKFDSGTGWPSFWAPIARENIAEISDNTLGMERTAVACRRCDAHLGHVFNDGPPPTGLRYCMNSASMRFVKAA